MDKFQATKEINEFLENHFVIKSALSAFAGVQPQTTRNKLHIFLNNRLVGNIDCDTMRAVLIKFDCSKGFKSDLMKCKLIKSVRIARS